MNTVFDLYLGYTAANANRRLNQIAEAATWTEGMKEEFQRQRFAAMQAEADRKRGERKTLRVILPILLAILIAVLAIIGGPPAANANDLEDYQVEMETRQVYGEMERNRQHEEVMNELRSLRMQQGMSQPRYDAPPLNYWADCSYPDPLKAQQCRNRKEYHMSPFMD